MILGAGLAASNRGAMDTMPASLPGSMPLVLSYLNCSGAKEYGFTREYINQVCNGKKPITDALAEILGYEKAKVWVKRKPK